MTTFTANIPATVSIKVQGHETDINVSDIPNDMLSIMVAYGIRRKYQDSINSIAKELRDNGDEVDGETLFHDFHERVLESELGMRGDTSTTDPLDKYRKSIVREILAKNKQSKGWAAYEAIDSADQKARGDFLLTIAAKNADKIDAMAQVRLDRANAKAKELAGLGDDLTMPDMEADADESDAETDA